ncbi:MAG: DUF4124 domain-containing protein [Betaproteobacteria bacterium]|nr:DUF4124 domain-containing protein [Betaproteobacteria bacterium]
MQKQSLFAIALIIGIAAALPVSAQVYKWKDEQGRTIISDKPRPGGSEEDLVAPARDSSVQATTPGKSLAEQELEFRQRQQQR